MKKLKLFCITSAAALVAGLGACSDGSSSKTAGVVGEGKGGISIQAQYILGAEVTSAIKNGSSQNVCFGKSEAGLVVYLCAEQQLTYGQGSTAQIPGGQYVTLSTGKEMTPGGWFNWDINGVTSAKSGHDRGDKRLEVVVGGVAVGSLDIIKKTYTLNSLCTGAYNKACDIDLTKGQINIIPSSSATKATSSTAVVPTPTPVETPAPYQTSSPAPSRIVTY